MADKPDKIDELVEVAYDFFAQDAKAAALSVGTDVARLIFEVYAASPLFVPERGVAVSRAMEICDTVALTGCLPGVKSFRDFSKDGCKARIGYDTQGVPKICLIKGIIGVSAQDVLVGYTSLVLCYALKPNGSSNGSVAHGKP